MVSKLPDVKEIRKTLIEHFGKDWWLEVLKWLKEELEYPDYYDLPEAQIVEYHPVFRPYLKSVFKISNTESASKRLIAYSRMNLLKHMRPSLLPQYLGIFCPVYRSRSIGNFGLVTMIPDKEVKDNKIFSRAFFNLPWPFEQKVKRTVISCYGITKHGRRIQDVEQYPHGGVFLVNPEHDPVYEKYAKYTDYAYVCLNWRFPKNYDEFIKTLDGSVLLSTSAAKKLRYKKIAYAIIDNPAKEISERKWLFIKTNVPKIGVKVEYQQPLVDVDADIIQMSSAVGTITEVECLNPNVADDKKKIWKIKIEDERDVEIGCKIESPQGLKHTVAGYTNDKDPVIVINPDAFKDRAIYTEVKKTGKIHCYPTIPGMDGNISTRNIRISRTLVQGIFCYPPKVQKELIDAIFNEKTLVNPFPREIFKILENMEKIDPDKLYKKYPVFHNFFYYTRIKKTDSGTYVYVEPTQLLRAWRELNRVKNYDKLSKFYQKAIDSFVNTIVKSNLLFDTEKKCKIKIKGHIRIILFHSNADVDTIYISPKLHKALGEPEYVLFAKEPVTRDLSIRCLKVKVKNDVPPWVCYIHPYLAMDHEKDEFHTKIDSDGDLAILIPLKRPIEKAMYHKRRTYKKLWKKYKNATLDTIKHFEPYKNWEDFIVDVYEYNRRESLEQLIMQAFGGIKNRAMFTDIIKDYKQWKEFVLKWDLELRGFQADKLNPELKDAPISKLNEYYEDMLNEALSYKLPDYAEEYQRYRELENVTFKNVKMVRETIKSLKKSKHPVMKLIYHIYKTLKMI